VMDTHYDLVIKGLDAGHCTVADLKSYTGCTESKVRAAILALKKRGFLSAHQESRRSAAIYTLLVEAHVAAAKQLGHSWPVSSQWSAVALQEAWPDPVRVPDSQGCKSKINRLHG